MLDQVEERRLAPSGGRRTRRPAGLLRASASKSFRTAQKVSSLVPPPRAAESQRLGDALGDQLGLLLAGEPRGDRQRLLTGILALRARHILHDLGERPVRDAFAVGQAAAAQHRRLGAEQFDELLHKPRLAHAGAAEHREQAAGPIADRILEHALQRPALPLSPDERRVEPAEMPGGVRDDRVQTDAVDGLSVLHGPTGTTLDQDSVSHEHVSRLADQDLARLRRLLKALGDVDRLTRDEEVPLRVVAGDHLAGVDADPGGKPDAPRTLELVVERGQRLAHLDRGPNRPQGIVLVQLPGRRRRP